jgi:hypothetical protein
VRDDDAFRRIGTGHLLRFTGHAARALKGGTMRVFATNLRLAPNFLASCPRIERADWRHPGAGYGLPAKGAL